MVIGPSSHLTDHTRLTRCFSSDFSSHGGWLDEVWYPEDILLSITIPAVELSDYKVGTYHHSLEGESLRFLYLGIDDFV